mmetsp:Transcript_7197/g.32896  ORF Transcript_7197/g.32896 Transcript_7197/m.32896 type:complete len:337 (+) Transcript_7197:2-1012(+)
MLFTDVAWLETPLRRLRRHGDVREEHNRPAGVLLVHGDVQRRGDRIRGRSTGEPGSEAEVDGDGAARERRVQARRASRRTLPSLLFLPEVRLDAVAGQPRRGRAPTQARRHGRDHRHRGEARGEGGRRLLAREGDRRGCPPGHRSNVIGGGQGQEGRVRPALPLRHPRRDGRFRERFRAGERYGAHGEGGGIAGPAEARSRGGGGHRRGHPGQRRGQHGPTREAAERGGDRRGEGEGHQNRAGGGPEQVRGRILLPRVSQGGRAAVRPSHGSGEPRSAAVLLRSLHQAGEGAGGGRGIHLHVHTAGAEGQRRGARRVQGAARRGSLQMRRRPVERG